MYLDSQVDHLWSENFLGMANIIADPVGNIELDSVWIVAEKCLISNQSKPKRKTCYFLQTMHGWKHAKTWIQLQNTYIKHHDAKECKLDVTRHSRNYSPQRSRTWSHSCSHCWFQGSRSRRPRWTEALREGRVLDERLQRLEGRCRRRARTAGSSSSAGP